MTTGTYFTKQLAAAVANGICTSQSGSAGVALSLNGSLVSNGIAVIDAASSPNNVGGLGRRVTISYTGTDTSFLILGTNAGGNVISDIAVGSGGTAQSNLDFVTVVAITPVGGGLTGVTAGTNGVGASPWWLVNWHGYSPVNVAMAVELVSGAINYTVQHTYDDMNNLPADLSYPTPFNDVVLSSQNGTLDGMIALPVKALRTIINSGTGAIRVRFIQAGIG